MALKSSDFEMKLKQIKMPSLGIDDDETKEMIATMAQMKDGVATIQVRDKETGITTEKKVEELTPEDIENLKKANEDSSKTIEELAFEQLDVNKQILNLLSTGNIYLYSQSISFIKLINFLVVINGIHGVFKYIENNAA